MTADTADQVVNEVSNIVSNLNEADEQSEDNLVLIVTVYDDIVDNLIDDHSNFFVSANVS